MRILYLHGFASGPSSKKAAFFRERIPALEVPDLAQPDFARMTISSQMRVLDRCAAGDAVALIGSSMGGYLAALFAARHAEVTKLVLLAPAFGFARRWSESADVDAWRRTGFLEVYHYGEKRMRQVSYRLLEDGLEYEDYPDFRQPALIFQGLNDAVVPPQFSRAFAGTHPNARLRLMDSDHELLNVLDTIWMETQSFLLR